MKITKKEWFEIKIGEGSRTGGTYNEFGEIDWGSEEHFLKIEIDAAGGNNFGDAATERFCSVPYSFKSAVSDSLSGVNNDTLKLMSAMALCPCSLQDAYDTGRQIEINQTLQNNNVLIFSNQNYPGSAIVTSISDQACQQAAGLFRIETGNTAAPPNNPFALVAENRAFGGALNTRVINNLNVPTNIVRNSIDSRHGGVLGSAINNEISNPANPSTAIQNLTVGTGHASFSTIRHNTNTNSAVRGEIQFRNNLQERSDVAQAGSFFVLNQFNTAIAFSTETRGLGGAGSFFINTVLGVTNPSDALITRTTGTGNALHTVQAGASGSSSLIELNTNTNPSDALVVNNRGLGIGGYFQNLFNTNSSYSMYSRTVGTGSAGGFQIQNATNAAIAITGTTNGLGKTVFIDNTNSNNTDNVLEITQTGTG